MQGRRLACGPWVTRNPWIFEKYKMEPTDFEEAKDLLMENAYYLYWNLAMVNILEPMD